MVRKSRTFQTRSRYSEIGVIRKTWENRIHVAVVYPSLYYVGMSNLGFQTVYRLFNAQKNVVCERAFLPENKKQSNRQIRTIESGTPLGHFDIIAFSVSFENDYPNIPQILNASRIPIFSKQRVSLSPLVICGGVACFLNPEPVAGFIDCFLIGEAEAIIPYFMEALDLNDHRKSCLKNIAVNVPGAYVPEFYKIKYKKDNTVSCFEPMCDVPEKIKRTVAEDISRIPTCTTVLTSDTIFYNTFLIEVSRGCAHGCRFCSAGYIYKPPRFRPSALLEKSLNHGICLTNKIGLVGAAVSDLPGLNGLCNIAIEKNISISFSSLRADALTEQLVSALRQSHVKTITIAPDAGSERMRKVIKKGLTESDILNAVQISVAGGILNVKLYFMVGLPTETMDDIAAIADLCKKVKQTFLKSSRSQKRIGNITVSINPFVPKPFTPFQWARMDDIKKLKVKIKLVKESLKKVANIRVQSASLRWAYIQGLLSRGDQRMSQILTLALKNHGNWPEILKAWPLNPDDYALRARSLDQVMPWDFIDHGIKKDFLAREYKKSLKL
jgi:radical SAM superfamily enzyme YgiQ (UPF0313 family)